MSDDGSNQPNEPNWGQPSQPSQPGWGQPGYGQPSYGQPPPNYLVWSILTLIFCCWPLSIVSIVFAAQVNNKFAAGDFAGAEASSRKAKQWAIWSAVGAVVLIVVLVIAAIGLAVLGRSSTNA